MNNLPRQTLRRIISKYGTEISRDARRCESLLNDLCGSYRREINVLITAIDERIPFDLLNGAGSMPLELLLNRLEKRLEEQTAMTAEAARWAVESWATALDLVTEDEIHTRIKRRESAAPNVKVEASQPDSSGNVISSINRRQPTQPPPVPTSRINPPVRQPAQMPKPAPPNVFPTNNQPANPISHQPPARNQPFTTGKGFGIFRGCLFVAALLAIASVVLFLGVPFAIEKMRETQYEHNKEPPRFSVR